MIVIGADTHKGSHALAAVDDGTGKVRGSRQIKAEEPGHLAAVRWARELDEERVWAIEDCRSCSRRLEQALLAAGERGVGGPPNRRGGVERFPGAYLNEQAMEIRLLVEHRNDLVAERTRTVNRLRWHLLELCPELEASLKRKALNQTRTLDRVERQLRKLPTGARVRIAREQISDLRGLNGGIERLAAELAELVTAHRPRLLAEHGCGALTAAILIGHTAGNERFRSEAAFALQTGTAPIPCSSGKRTQHRLNRGGDRQLNHALHIIAVTRAQHDPATKQYLARKEAEGKTKKGALRSLKRHLARRFHQLLSEPPADQQPASEPASIIEPELPSIPDRPKPQREVEQIAAAPSRWSASAKPRK